MTKSVVDKAKHMTDAIEAMHKEIDQMVIDVHDTDSFITITMNGQHQVLAVKLADNALTASKKTLENAIQSVYNKGCQTIIEQSQAQLKKIAAQLDQQGAKD